MRQLMKARTLAALTGVAVLGLGVVACHKASGPEEQTKQGAAAGSQPAAKTIIGWLHGNCLAVQDAALSDGTPLLVASLGDTPSVVNAKVDHKLRDGDTCYALLQDRRKQNESAGRSFYIVSLPETLEMAIGVVAAPPQAAVDGQLDLDGDGKPERFVQCATAEGVKFSVWSGEPYLGTPLWSDYYYLAYDTEATCP
jgi:hypothetical protein